MQHIKVDLYANGYYNNAMTSNYVSWNNISAYKYACLDRSYLPCEQRACLTCNSVKEISQI